MPFLITLLFVLLLATGCNKGTESGSQEGESATADSQVAEEKPQILLERRRVLAAFSGTETDEWTAAMLGSLGSELSFDPWEISDADEFFDYYGPYDVLAEPVPIDLMIVLTGMDAVSGLQRQQAAADHLLEQVKQFGPDLVWLDGDQLQFSAGRMILDEGYQLAFSGLQFDSSLYYDAEDEAAGFYRRHSVSGTMGRIWRDNDDALFHCIASDDSPEGRRRLVDFSDAEDLLGEGSTLHVLPVFTSWQELAEAIELMPEDTDDLIICAAGLDGSSEELSGSSPPEDILAFSPVPVYVLGPSKLDMLGCTSLYIKPAAQVHEMLTVFRANLGQGISMSQIPTIVPEDMQVRVSEAPEVLPRSGS